MLCLVTDTLNTFWGGQSPTVSLPSAVIERYNSLAAVGEMDQGEFEYRQVGAAVRILIESSNIPVECETTLFNMPHRFFDIHSHVGGYVGAG